MTIIQPVTTGTNFPAKLGMEKTIELTGAREETFFYRDKHKRIIDHRVVNEVRWRRVGGPLLYAVTDWAGHLRYIGKWEGASALYGRWLRRNTIHHQESARNLYIADLDAGLGPIAVWSVSVQEIQGKLPEHVRTLPEKVIAAGLEALWIQRWKDQLAWNSRPEPVPAGFSDGEYWR